MSNAPTLTNCILWNNGSEIENLYANASVSYSIIQGGYSGMGNLNTDPLFTDPANGDLRLQPCSPAIDAGNDADNNTTLDLGGNSRKFDAATGGQQIDMGAYEYQALRPIPNAKCKNISVNLTNTVNYSVSVTPSQINDFSTGCPVLSLLINDQNSVSFNCANVGQNSVMLTVKDYFNNLATCNATVTVTENIPPVAKCKSGTTNVFLDANGQLILQSSAVNNNSSDNCGAPALAVSPNQFSCSDLGVKTVTLTATDPSNNSSACTAQIRVRDNTKPTAVCQNVTTAIGANGFAYITPYQVNNGSTDNCTINGLTLSKSQFSCANIGNNTVTLSVKDQSLNVGTCTATITVVDNGGIQAKCKEVFLNLNSIGQGSITAAQVNNNSTDNCSGITNMTVVPSQFTCSNIGANVVVLTVHDNNGNSATCWTQVYVGDHLAPNAVCQPATISLNQNGQATLQPSQVNNGSTDNCTIASMSVNPNQFTAPGQQTVTLTVTDGFGYTAACTATVTIQPYSLPREAAANTVAAAFDLRLAPNPAARATNLLFFLEQEGPVRVRLFNSEGREVMTNEYAGIAGENVIAVQLGQWSAGVYYVQFSAQGGVTTKRLVIQKN